MATVKHESEKIRKAAKWVFEERKFSPQTSNRELIEKAATKYDLSPMEVEFLGRYLKDHVAD